MAKLMGKWCMLQCVRARVFLCTGKRCNNDGTRAALGGWTPKYTSFASFMMSGGKDFYNTCGLF